MADSVKKRPRFISYEHACTIASIHKTVRELKENGVLNGDVNSLVASWTGVSKSTVKKVGKNPKKKDFQPQGKKMRYARAEFEGAASLTQFVRTHIAQARAQAVSTSARDLFLKIKQVTDEDGEPIFIGSFPTFYRRMRSCGFRMRDPKTYKQYISERPFVIRQRRIYLERIQQYRDEGRPILYQDESWVNSRMRCSSEWSFEGDPDPTKVASGDRGQRAILVGIGSNDGFVKDSFLCYRGRHAPKSADYHTDVNSDVFIKWMREKVIPNSPQGAVFVIDRASYHLKLTPETRPCPSNANKDVQLRWLRDHQVEIRNAQGDLVTDEQVMDRKSGITKWKLADLCRKHKPEPRYLISVLLDEFSTKDFKLLILPVHHPELNPIEKIWSVIKNYCRKNNHGGTKSLGLIERLVEEALELCTPHVWKGCEKKCMKVEEAYRESDQLLDAESEEVEDDEDDDSLEIELDDELAE
eukprot:CAMPEP_0177647928 /NCGR_PEP_ID=MMETSP0447-20121125/10558_1 /TAXON_ID=0 /ORGANISM="Stygamoeba regulata, Strain BSH-02190019" /LENGTH=469 /DNA_ID=CAMNT_0019150539 /DNA_START=133 /DNA_END=1542 /DNA_ORIENTATION=-